MDAERVEGCIQDEATCSVCLDFFKEPVILDCGHSFCKLCITQYWQPSQSNVSCPQCRETFANVNFRPNRQLASLLVFIKQLHLQESDPGKMAGVCKLHQKPLNLFCSDDQEFLCVVCAKSKVHSDHLIAPMEAATKTHKDEILTLLEVKKKQREELLQHFSEAGAQRQNVVKLMEEGTQKIVLEFKHLCYIMKDLQVELTEQAASMKRDFDARLIDFSGEISATEKQIDEMKKKYEQPATEFLQDIKQTLNRCRADAHTPENFSSELKEKVWDLSVRSLFLQDVLRTCRESLLSKPKLERANVTLNPATAHTDLVLSNGYKSVKHGSMGLPTVTQPQGFHCVPCVLGCEVFTSGRHYWEVEITAADGNWAVGVAMESIKRKTAFTVSPEEGIWALQPENYSPPWHKGISRVHIYLDYEAGRVAFFDASSSDLIATFPPAYFSGQRILPFFMLRELGSQMKLCS